MNNKIKRVEYCQYLLDTAETFDDVFTDETMVILIIMLEKSITSEESQESISPG